MVDRVRLQTLILCLLAAIVAACESDQAALTDGDHDIGMPPPDPTHNVIVISFDALRQDALGAYGSSQGLTPELDALAARGLVFSNAFTAGQSTPSSFAAAFTGQLPMRVFRKWQLQDVETLAERYQRHGFTTAALLNNVQLTAERHFDQGFEHYRIFADREDTEVLAATRDWLRAAPKQPFFLWIHFINPHTPYEYRQASWPPGKAPPEMLISPKDIDRAERGRYSEQKDEQIRALYENEVRHVDGLFGALIGELEALGLLDESLLLVTADHGEAFGEHRLYGHRQLFDPVIRIPMILYHPQVRPGQVQAPVSNVDLMATLSEFSGLASDQLSEGVSWYQPLTAQRPIFSTVMTNQADFAMAVRSDGYKLISWCNPDNPREALFNLDQDPLEQRDLIDSDVFQTGRLYELMEAIGGQDPCVTIRNASRGRGESEGLAEETIEKLKSLGYLQ